MDDMVSTMGGYASKMKNGVKNPFSQMSGPQWIRLIVIVCAYLLVRPWLVKLGAYIQEKSHEREVDPEEVKGIKKRTANSLRGGKHYEDEAGMEDSDNEFENKKTTSTDWGKKARKRQRKAAKEMLEEELQQKEWDEWSDPDVEDLLS